MFPPSNWDGSLAARSSMEPRAGLKLEHVHGYSGMSNTAPNVFFNADAHIVYYTASVGIVYDPETHTQRFFRVGRASSISFPPPPPPPLFLSSPPSPPPSSPSSSCSPLLLLHPPPPPPPYFSSSSSSVLPLSSSSSCCSVPLAPSSVAPSTPQVPLLPLLTWPDAVALQEHTDDIKCMAIAPDRRYVATGQVSPPSIQCCSTARL